MLRSYDTRCKECYQIIEQFLENDEKLDKCPVCGGETERIYTTMNYKLLFNNKTDICGWGADGYASSQYWSKIKEAEEKTGKKYKAIDED